MLQNPETYREESNIKFLEAWLEAAQAAKAWHLEFMPSDQDDFTKNAEELVEEMKNGDAPDVERLIPNPSSRFMRFVKDLAKDPQKWEPEIKRAAKKIAAATEKSNNSAGAK
jgi:hypothetical protein